MTDRRAKVPGPNHPITIERNPARVVVLAGLGGIADSCEAVTLVTIAAPAWQKGTPVPAQ
jgi:uncharacterized protein (DUF427 family)